MTIKKAVIPAAGLGTRFLPATKALPKEMLPIVDKPTIQFIVEEAVESGIEDIIIVTGRNKKPIEDHFDKNYELELNLQEKNNHNLLKMVEGITNLAEIHYVRQKRMLGLGHAIWCARKFVGSEPFAVLLGDVITDSNPPCLKELIQTYVEVQSSVIAVETVDWEQVGKYGVIDGEQLNKRLYKVNKLVEKPKFNPPSNIAMIGRYILEPEIFSILEQISPSVGGEIQLTDALQTLAQHRDLYAHMVQGRVYDVGDKLGYLKAMVEFACKAEFLKDDFITFLKHFVAERGGSDCEKH